MIVRCVNIDWLEVYCLEPITESRDASYFRSRGFIVQERDYGTRIYNQMFTLMGSDYQPLLEVRRSPKSVIGQGGILPVNACHIRLVNRTCYYDDAALKMKQFLQDYGFIFQRISRIDICLDFERFDSGDYPGKFLKRYLEHAYAKINQARITTHGEDGWSARSWNSISWGNKKSAITTRLYCKTQELREVKDKPYIREAWFRCGLVDDPIKLTKVDTNGETYCPDIWRLEFSISSAVQGWFVIEEDGKAKKKRSIRNTLDMYQNRLSILAVFASLAQHYFHFKYYRREQQRLRDHDKQKKGLVQQALTEVCAAAGDLSDYVPRKDRCQDKILFRWKAAETVYHIDRPSVAAGTVNQYTRLEALLNRYKLEHTQPDIVAAVDVVLESIQTDSYRQLLPNPWDNALLQALRAAVAIRMKNKAIDKDAVVNDMVAFIQQHAGEFF